MASLFGIDRNADWRTQTRQASQAYDRGNMSYPEFVAESLAIPTRALGETLQEAVPDFVSDSVRYALDLPGPRMFGAILPELPSVQRTVQADQALTEQFPEGYPRAKRFAGNVATVADMAGGMMPVARAVRLSDPLENRAMFSSGGPVYKEGHYNKSEVPLNDFEEFLMENYDIGATPNAVNRYKAVKGNVQFGAEILKNAAKSMFDPYTRARYTEYGIAPIYDKMYEAYKRAEKTGDPTQIRNALEIAHNQMQAMSNIKRQAGQVPRGRDMTFGFAEAASDVNSPKVYFRPTEYGDDWFAEAVAPGSTFGGFRPEDSKFIQNHVEKVWAGKKGYNPDKTYVTVKTPRSDITGNHFRDVLANNKAVTKVSNLFLGKGGPSYKTYGSVEELKQALKTLESDNKYTRGEKAGQIKKDSLGRDRTPPIKVLKSDDTGVWITITDRDAVIGTAKTEGGVNMLVKVEPDGNLTGVMSDAHNMYEEFRIPFTKTKVRNRLMEKALEDDVIALTPPMQTNVVSISKEGKFGDAAEELREAPRETMPVPARARQSEAKGLTEPRDRVIEAGEIQPSVGEVARQTVPVAQNIVALESLLGNYEEDPFAPTIR